MLFPLGVLLAWAGVLEWLLYAVGATAEYRAVFHATAQIQGFMTCLAVGFLYTFVPRRTAAAEPTHLQLAVAAAAPVAATLAALDGRVALAQALWGAGLLNVAVFVSRRVLGRAGLRGLPGVFVWVPAGLAAAVIGAVLVAVAAVLGPAEEPELWRLGRGLLLQGFLTALVVGVGGTMIPVLTRGPGAAAPAAGSASGRAAQTIAAALFLASFPLEAYLAPRAGLALRGVISGAVLVSEARLWRPPSIPGLHRWLIWSSAWLLPAGYLAAAAAPEPRSTALHVVFVGGFALMALSVSLHVALSHAGRPDALASSPWQVRAMAGLLLVALASRLLAGVDAARSRPWLGLASGAFLLATVAWGSLVGAAVRAAAKSREASA
ncbi:NnrS family protein [Anaeromyxobacter oryzae]|uniref:NnrS family protein n=1 Tax=Anaeromyxobacter oryzae TaxID=2918170 RepID=UPI0020BF400E|nr:NnrS family protein [Anaeromyxobacter oryzae]